MAFRYTLGRFTIVRLTLDIPDEFASQVAPSGHDPARAALEAIALEAYREQRLTKEQIRRFLGLSTGYEVDGFLKERGIYLDLSAEDVEQDAAASREFRKQWPSFPTRRP
jgi:hypothetical protein